MIRCDNCGTDNLDGSEYCDECGMKVDLPPRSMFGSNRGGDAPAYQPPSAESLRSARNGDPEGSGPYRPGNQIRPQPPLPVDAKRQARIEAPLPSPPSFTTSTSIPRPARPARDPRLNQQAPNEKPVGGFSPEPLAPGRTLVLSSRGRTDALRSDPGKSNMGASVASKLVIERGGRIGREFAIATAETHIGRWDADSGIFPDVDLDQDDPEAKVSRRHARIINQNGQYFIEDLGSTNGTFVNRGRRLLPGHRHLLQSGDEIIVGKTFLKFHIIS